MRIKLKDLQEVDKIEFFKKLFNFDRKKEYEFIAFTGLCKFSNPKLTTFEVLIRFIETDNMN